MWIHEKDDGVFVFRDPELEIEPHPDNTTFETRLEATVGAADYARGAFPDADEVVIIGGDPALFSSEEWEESGIHDLDIVIRPYPTEPVDLTRELDDGRYRLQHGFLAAEYRHLGEEEDHTDLYKLVRLRLPRGQIVDVFCREYEERYGVKRQRKGRNAPPLREFLCERLELPPGTDLSWPLKLRRAYLFVSMKEWPEIEAHAGEQPRTIEKIIAAGIAWRDAPKPKRKKKKTLKERVSELTDHVSKLHTAIDDGDLHTARELADRHRARDDE